MSEFGIPSETMDQIEKAQIESAKAQQMEKKRLKEEEKDDEIKVSPEEMEKFWACMLKGEPYTQEFDVKGFKFGLKTRKGAEVKESVEYLDKLVVNLPETRIFFDGEVLLANAIVHLNNNNIENMPILEKLALLRTIPGPISSIISQKLDEFDAKIFKMTDEVAKGNF